MRDPVVFRRQSCWIVSPKTLEILRAINAGYPCTLRASASHQSRGGLEVAAIASRRRGVFRRERMGGPHRVQSQPEAEEFQVNPVPILTLRVFDAIDAPHHTVARCQVPRSTAPEAPPLVRIGLRSPIHSGPLEPPEGPLSRSFRSYSGVAVVTCPPCARLEPAQAALPERRGHRGSLVQ